MSLIVITNRLLSIIVLFGGIIDRLLKTINISRSN